MNKPRKIAVFTGTRAEYGLLYWIIKELSLSEKSKLQLIVGGMHLSHEFGYTVSKIEDDGFYIDEKIEFLLSSDSPVGISKSMGLALIGAAESLDRLKPDLLLLLGDRFEALSVAQAAMIARIPIAHIHGGESTEGLIDEAIRHSITKMSHLHFTSTEKYRRRVIQLGEKPELVFNFGAPGIDNIARLPIMEKNELSQSLNFDLGDSYFVITYHPVTLVADGAICTFKKLLEVLDRCKDTNLVISYPNADTCGRKIIKLIETYKAKNPKRIFAAQSLGQIRYLSLLKHCAAVIGNSSSGLVEAPAFGVPVLNIGERQKGRIAADSVVHCSEDSESIKKGIEKILSPAFREFCKKTKNPYGTGGGSKKIVETLENHPLGKIISKKFYDLASVK